MKLKAKFILACSTSIGSLIMPLGGVAMAQDIDGSQTEAAPEVAEQTAQADSRTIIVTARRIAEPLQDVPISISVFDQEVLTQQGIDDATDLANITPSLAANSRYGPEKATFSIRGFGQEQNTSPAVGIYFADVVTPRGAGSFSSGDGAGAGAFFDLENVQVLKGPQGTLFGRNTTGGAVLLVPKKPTAFNEGFVEVSGGNYDMMRAQGVVNLAVSDNFRVRAGIDRMKRDGYLKNQSDTGPSDFGDVDYVSARLSAVIDLTPDLENYTIVRFAESDTNGTVQRLIAQDGGPLAGAFGAVAQEARQNARGDGFYDVDNGHPDPSQFTREWGIINTTTYQASDNLTIKNIASYAELQESYNANIYGLNGQTFEYINTYTMPGYYGTDQSTFVEELQFQGSALDNRLEWQAGAYLEVSKPLGRTNVVSTLRTDCDDATTFDCDPAVGGSISQSVLQKSFNTKALYAQGTYDLTDQLAVTAGLRYTWDKTTASAENRRVFITPGGPDPVCNGASAPAPTAPTFAECFVEFTAKSNKPTWLLGLDYKPNDDILLYAKYARGYRQGGVTPHYTNYETWGPEKVDNFEIGAKTTFGGALNGRFNIAAFYNDFQDQQLLFGLVGNRANGVLGGTAVVNAGESRSYGVEIDSSVEPFQGLTLNLAYTYLNTKLQSVEEPVVIDPDFYNAISSTNLEGEDLLFSPEHQLFLSGQYVLPLPDSIGEMSIGASYSFTDNQYANHVEGGYGKLQKRNIVNLNADWRSIMGSNFDLGLFVNNLTKDKFYLATTGNFEASGFESAVLNQPRMYGARLRYTFGD